MYLARERVVERPPALTWSVPKFANASVVVEPALIQRFASGVDSGRIRLDTAFGLRGPNIESLNLDRHDIRIRQRLHPYESAVLCAQYAVFKICKVVELAEFSRLVCIV